MGGRGEIKPANLINIMSELEEAVSMTCVWAHQKAKDG